MMEINHSMVAIIAKLGDSAIELDSIQFAPISLIDAVINEDGTTGGDPVVLTQRKAAVSVEDGR